MESVSKLSSIDCHFSAKKKKTHYKLTRDIKKNSEVVKYINFNKIYEIDICSCNYARTGFNFQSIGPNKNLCFAIIIAHENAN